MATFDDDVINHGSLASHAPLHERSVTLLMHFQPTLLNYLQDEATERWGKELSLPVLELDHIKTDSRWIEDAIR